MQKMYSGRGGVPSSARRPREDYVTPAIKIADCICGECRPSANADKDGVDLISNQAVQILQPGIADISNLVSQFLAPVGDCLGHYACQIGIHDAYKEPFVGPQVARSSTVTCRLFIRTRLHSK